MASMAVKRSLRGIFGSLYCEFDILRPVDKRINIQKKSKVYDIITDSINQNEFDTHVALR
jgi:hypothetical protein